jgi:hypothetical protein
MAINKYVKVFKRIMESNRELFPISQIKMAKESKRIGMFHF